MSLQGYKEKTAAKPKKKGQDALFLRFFGFAVNPKAGAMKNPGACS
jgi:hypothetical protein